MTNVSPLTASFAPEQVIHVKVEGNPKKPSGKSYARFALYEDGITVAQFVQRIVDAGNKETVAIADLRWDTAHKFIAISEPTEADTVPATESAPEEKPVKTKVAVSRPKTKKPKKAA